MKNLTIRAQIAGIFTIMLVIVGAAGFYIHSRLEMIEHNMRVLSFDAGVGVYQLGRVKEALSEDRLAVATGRTPKGRAVIEPLIDQYERSVQTPEDREVTGKFKVAYTEYEDAKSALLGRGVGAGAPESSGIVRNLDARYRALLQAAEDVLMQKNKRAGVIAVGIDADLQNLIKAMIAIFVLLIVVGVLGGARLTHIVILPLRRLTTLMDVMRQGDFTQRMDVIRRDELGELSEGFNRMADEVMALVGQVQRSGIRVSTSMTEIAATSKQQQATAAEVAATTTQIGATSREISATSRELVRTMGDVATVAEHAASLASGSQSELAHMEETMHQVMDAAGSINTKLAVLNERASDINQMVTTITKVADQTNLLSLNAAIEAEKAGEYGRGFAVVSSEIRRLADQTAVATYDIEQMVKDIQSAVSASVMGMDKFSEEVRRGLHDVHEIGGKLTVVIGEVQALAPRFESVSEGMQMQATGAEQISEALLQLTDATQQTVESLRQSSFAIDELNQVSGGLQGSIARFKLAAA
jgi:methyl-accepting chemotaxis protein WspA